MIDCVVTGVSEGGAVGVLAKDGRPATELDADVQRLPDDDGEAVAVAESDAEDVCELCALRVDCAEPEVSAVALEIEVDVGASTVGDEDAVGDKVPLALAVLETPPLTVNVGGMLPESVLQDVDEAVAVELCVGTPLDD